MDTAKSNKLKQLGIQLGIFCILFLAACATYHFYLTNEFTPGSDGKRIYPYLKYMEKVPEQFPLWQAHKHHGYPLLADPENHMPLSLVLDTESEYFNLHLNLVFFFLTSIFAFLCYWLARMLDMSKTASLSAGLVTIVGSLSVIRGFMHGAFNFFFYMVLIYAALCLLLWVISRRKSMYLLLLVPIILAWTIQAGYYLPIIFHFPAFIFLICLYQKQGASLLTAAKSSFLLLILAGTAAVLLAMPFFLPILDGIWLSNTFGTDTPTIEISDRAVYNYYFGMWPFIVLAALYSWGSRRRMALLFAIMGSINFILMLLSFAGFEEIFELWSSLPVLKNIRHQMVFAWLASIAAAFCAGLLIDSCRYQTKAYSNYYVQTLKAAGLSLLLLYVLHQQISRDLSIWMAAVTAAFILTVLLIDHSKAVFGLFIIIVAVMSVNLDSTPLKDRNKLNTSDSKEQYEFVNYNGPYFWWEFSGRDRYTPYFEQHRFSMVFPKGYRQLLSLLYEQEITVQRPHWIDSKQGVNTRKMRPEIARLMGIRKPESQDWESPFRVYDQWIVADEQESLQLMKQEDFSVQDPIILADKPGIPSNPEVPLQAEAELAGKTAETLTLQVSSNKDCIVLIPEIYHRGWRAYVDGSRSRVIKAYTALRAVAVPAGEHKVFLRFAYQPFWWGLYIAIGSLLIMTVLVYVFRDKLKDLLWPEVVTG